MRCNCVLTSYAIVAVRGVIPWNNQTSQFDIDLEFCFVAVCDYICKSTEIILLSQWSDQPSDHEEQQKKIIPFSFVYYISVIFFFISYN